MSVEGRRAAQAGSFGAAAAAYERGRPSYPGAALDWLLPAGSPRVLDLGAGTGKLTRQLHDRGADVVAVEPSPGMRDELQRVLPGVRVLAGTAEQIPLASGAVDVVLVAQAWHWVDVDRAVPEVARVLAPPGRLGLLWNVRDERHDWVRELGRIMRAGTEQPTTVRPNSADGIDPRVGHPFAPLERFEIAWTAHLTRDAMLDLVTSRSYIITMQADQRRAVLDEVRALLDTHPALTGSADVELPYLTRCLRTGLAAR